MTEQDKLDALRLNNELLLWLAEFLMWMRDGGVPRDFEQPWVDRLKELRAKLGVYAGPD